MTADRRPNFFLIGAPKAGTTSLFDYLLQHPQVYPSRTKETHFFWDDDKYARGMQWYTDKYFSGAQNYLLRGDGTPKYLRCADIVAPRIQQMAHDYRPKFLVILRDPVERAWSNYLHVKSKMIETLDFGEALAREETRRQEDPYTFLAYFYQGMYATQLEQWLGYFDRSQFHFVLFSDFKADAVGTVEGCLEFLGADLARGDIDTSGRKNRTGQPRSRLLFKWLRNPPRWASRAFRTLLPLHLQHDIRHKLTRALIRPFESGKPTVPTEVARELRARYTDDIERLEALLERDLSAWKSSPQRSAS